MDPFIIIIILFYYVLRTVSTPYRRLHLQVIHSLQCVDSNVPQGLFQVVSRDTPFHLERKGLVDLRYMTIRIEIIFGSSLFFFSFFSLFFPFSPSKLFKSFADRNQTSTLDARYDVLHIQIMHIVLQKSKLIVAIECSLRPYNNIKCWRCTLHMI